jgi:predicted alpha/beta superfamily hydrolase
MKTLLLALFFLISFCSFGQFTSTDTLSYYSEYFRGRRQLKISLPEAYNDYPNRRYKVIYLFDAQSSALYDFTKATVSFFPGYANFYYDPVILVGIETRNRHFEFLPKQLNTRPTPNNYSQAGGADTLALSIEKELKPLIERKYRTNGFTIGIGHSLGGTFITHAMLKFSKIFSAGICISPNYLYDDEVIFSTFKEAVERKYLSGRFLYIAYGSGDETEEKFKKSTIKFGDLLKESKIQILNYKVDRLNNNDHSTTPMEGIFKGLVFINDHMNLPYEKYKVFLNTNSPGSFIEYLKKYFGIQSIKAGIPLPSIGELNTIAYNSFYADRKKEAIQILEWAISLYSDDANLYDSMGEIQEAAGNFEKAKYYYQQGLSVTELQKDELPESSYKSKVTWFKKRLDKIAKK